MDNYSIKPITISKGKIVYSNSSAAIMQIIMSFLTFFTLLTPRDALGFKKLFLGVALVFSIGAIIRGLQKNKGILVFAIILPIMMYLLSTIDTGSPTLALSYLYPFAYLLLIFPIVDWNIDVKKIALQVGNIMAAIILLSCALDFIGALNIYNNPLLAWLNTNGEAKISKSIYAMFKYVLFFNASPILYFNLTNYIKENKKGYMVLSFAALLFTGTRANIYLGAALLMFGMLFLSKKLGTKIIIVIGALLVVAFFGAELLDRYHILAFAKSSGDLSRVGGFGSIIDTLNSHKSYWLTGMGFGSTYYNAGKMQIVETSELSYLEFIREIGLPFSIIVFGYLLYPLLKLRKIDGFLLTAFGAYLVAGIFEPFIFTSTGFFVVMMVYAEIMKNKKYKKNIIRGL